MATPSKDYINRKLQKYPKALAKVNELINMIGESKFTMEMAEWIFDFFNNASFERPVDEVNKTKMNEANKTKMIAKRLKEDTAYQEFFKKAMAKFNIKTPADLKDPVRKKEFFDYIDTNYKAKDETNESLRKLVRNEVRKMIKENTKSNIETMWKTADDMEGDLVNWIDNLFVEQGEEGVAPYKEVLMRFAEYVDDGKYADTF